MSHSPILLCGVVGLLVHGTAFAEPPGRLRCEWLESPMVVGVPTPRFSWEFRSTNPGARQTAYQVSVVAAPEAATGNQATEMWSSGKVASPATMLVEYAGPALRSGKRYFWSVRTWDEKGQSFDSAPATFAMGLLDPADWKASWIGDTTPAPEIRVAHNGFHAEFTDKAETIKWITIDLGEPRSIDRVKLFPARPHDFTPDTPGFGFPVRYRILASDSDTFAQPRVLVDRTKEDADRATEPVELAFPPTKSRYVRLEAVKLRQDGSRGYTLALAEMQVLEGEAPVSSGAPVAASDALTSNDWSPARLTDDDLTSHKASGWEALPAALLRKEFTLPTDVSRATLYITALGLYDARINGRRVGNHLLAPEWTDYHTRVQYQGYDVTALLGRGDNAIGVTLADGWYAGRLGMAQQFTPDKRPRAVYGRKPRLLAQLHIDFADGTATTFVTDGSWTCTTAGPVRSADLLDGVVYDARNEMQGFDRAGFIDSVDEPVWAAAGIDRDVTPSLVPQPNEPIRAIQLIQPIAMNEPRPGVYVFDMGQNMPGWCRIRVKGRSGTHVQLRHVEALNDDGTVYTANLRGAPQIVRYTLSGDPTGETWEPLFTYHGFRFVEWTGSADPPSISSLEGVVVCTDAPMAGTFECSSPMLNKLWKNILWTQHANTMSVPTDCPQRDERLGWMGDILAFSQTASFNKDMAAFYTKWLTDVRDAQADDGRMPDVAPHPYDPNKQFSGVPAWGDAGVFVPWNAYENYADTRLISDNYDACRRWVDWIHEHNPELLWKNKRHNDYNDWLNGDSLIAEGWSRTGGEIPKDVFATAFFARSTWMVAQMARVLGRDDDVLKYTLLHDQIRDAFIKAFVAPDAKLPGDTQAGYAIALGFNLLPPDKRPAAVDHLVRGIGAYKNHLSTGFHSTIHAMNELTRAGHADLAYTLVNNTTFPSWGYSIENGATTIWERWDGYVKGRGFQDPGMNSLNHWALGSVGEWMMRTIVGINPDPATPGWGRFLLQPVPGGGHTWAKGSYHSCRGMIESSWKIEPDATVYEFTIPANTTAVVTLPAADPAKVTAGSTPLASAPGVKLGKGSAGVVTMDVSSGKHVFRVAR